MVDNVRDELKKRLDGVLASINAASQKVGRDPASIRLIAVSKKQSLEKMKIFSEIWPQEKTPPCFGENYVQEYREKKASLLAQHSCHLIGPLQSNKARDAALLFDCIQTVHKRSLLQKLNTAAEQLGKVQDIYLQVNISGDQAKSGFEPDELLSVVEDSVSHYSALSLCGLMTITRYYQDPEEARDDFKKMRELHQQAGELSHQRLELSMGMSADYHIAIEEGATVVRVGTALFGERE